MYMWKKHTFRKHKWWRSNKKGPKMDPWGTPQVICTTWEVVYKLFPMLYIRIFLMLNHSLVMFHEMFYVPRIAMWSFILPGISHVQSSSLSPWSHLFTCLPTWPTSQPWAHRSCWPPMLWQWWENPQWLNSDCVCVCACREGMQLESYYSL